jgi:hypothetical protein
MNELNQLIGQGIPDKGVWLCIAQTKRTSETGKKVTAITMSSQMMFMR